jgi:magnesium chelatase subunit I
MERRSAFDEDPEVFCRQWQDDSALVVERIQKAIDLYPEVKIDRSLQFDIVSYCLDVGVDGHRGDIIMLKTAKTLAAYHGRTEVIGEDIDMSAELALPHRVRRQPLQDIVVDVQSMQKQAG